MTNRSLDVELYIGTRDSGVRIARVRATQARSVRLFFFFSIFFIFYFFLFYFFQKGTFDHVQMSLDVSTRISLGERTQKYLIQTKK